MKKQNKMISAERQDMIIKMLMEEVEPISGSVFAKLANVSRQVIVQDVSILKAKNEPIIATSQGYLYLKERKDIKLYRRVIACTHRAEQTKEELYIIVDHGVTIKNVIVEHAVYGDLTASIHVNNRKEVDQFVAKIKTSDASYLSSLTDGIHLHTLEADSSDKIDAACIDLKKAHILI